MTDWVKDACKKILRDASIPPPPAYQWPAGGYPVRVGAAKCVWIGMCGGTNAPPLRRSMASSGAGRGRSRYKESASPQRPHWRP